MTSGSDGNTRWQTGGDNQPLGNAGGQKMLHARIGVALDRTLVFVQMADLLVNVGNFQKPYFWVFELESPLVIFDKSSFCRR
jgi:hypothetical protein